MRILHFYLVRQILATLVMTVAVFTFVLLLGNVLKEILALLVNHQAPLGTVGAAIALLIPFVLVFALPMGLLTATLLVFGRFSADQELTAMRASGVSLVALVTPILLLSLACSGVCALVNLQLAPQCRVAYKRLLVSAGAARLGAMLQEKTFIKDFPKRIVYVGQVEGAHLKDILIYNLDGETVESYVRAAEGQLHFDHPNQVVKLQLVDAWWVNLQEGQGTQVPNYWAESFHSYTNTAPAEAEEKIKLTDMTFAQLRRQLHDLEKRLATAAPPPAGSTDELRAKLRELEAQKTELTLPIKVQIHRQVAFSFACVGFTLVGIPLGIRAHRRETTFNIAVALILVLLYYSFFILGESLVTRPAWHPHLILWLPNFIFQAIGAVLLWRANRGI